LGRRIASAIQGLEELVEVVEYELESRAAGGRADG
jgi:hypothetical protein